MNNRQRLTGTEVTQVEIPAYPQPATSPSPQKELDMAPPPSQSNAPWSNDRRRAKFRKRVGLVTYAAFAIWAIVLIRAVFVVGQAPSQAIHPTHSVRYLGVYEPDAPDSYNRVDQFAKAIGRQPNIVSYYSHWNMPFATNFVTTAAKRGAVTLVQLAPRGISLASIASGRYDPYLRGYARAVKSYGQPVILSFGHEMNGTWYSWGLHHTPPPTFVAAWQHIVSLFRETGVRNVTWLWTVNIIGQSNHSPRPNRWWPGSSYVNWVGIDGYYRNSSSGFASVFGPTIASVRELTPDPILIAETAAQPSTGQSAKIRDLFAGVQTFGLLGFVWFDKDDTSVSAPGEKQYWRISSSAALSAFGRDAQAFMKPKASPASMHLRSSSKPSSP